MSELKVILATPHPKMKNACDGAIEVYLKSEVDRYISELIADQQLELDEWYCRVEHQKYKRCVAMADFCSYKAWYYKYNGKEEIFYRWMKYRRIWAELAKQYKEAK